METYRPQIRFSLQKALGHLYFFFNSLGLKGGLLYTNILTPFFVWSLYKHRQLKPLLSWTLLLLAYMCIQFFYGVDLKSFLISGVLFFSTLVFLFSARFYILTYKDLKMVMRQILIVNFFLLLVAIPFYFMEYNYQKWFWYTNVFTGQTNHTRLALFTYEASYYSLLLVPLCYYYWFKLILNIGNVRKEYVLLMTILPLLLSLSFGIIGGTAIAAIVLCFINREVLVKYRLTFQLIGLGFVLCCIIILVFFIFFPNSLVVKRVSNIFSGVDTSTNGRTFESFQIAWLTIQKKSIWFGCGLGQLKHLIPEVIQTHFAHWGKLEVYRIPNAMAETLGIFGIFGFLLRLLLQFYLFFKTKVYCNHYQLALFIFIFIYQFTGSYITNIVEYVIWIFAFTPVFSEFNKAPSTQLVTKNE
jgi:hypothetical protein